MFNEKNNANNSDKKYFVCFERHLEAGLELLEVPDGHHDFVQTLLNLWQAVRGF